MPAIITDDIKKLLVQKIIEDTSDSDTRYFVGIGRADTWQDSTDIAPIAGQVINSPREQINFRSNLQSVILTDTVSFVSKRYNWSSGTIYKAYQGDVSALGNGTSNDIGNGQYYVITENNRIYICLEQGKTDTGSVNPSLNNPGDEILPSEGTKKLGDGYIWKFLTVLDPVKLNNFSTSNYIPVEKVDSATGGNFNTIAEQQQLAVQAAATPGEIVGYKIVTAGAGYDSADVITVKGNGSGAGLTFKVSPQGGIVKVSVDSNGSGGFQFGSGYNFANVEIASLTATVPAVIRPVISKNGIGADIRDDLRATALMVNAKLVGEAGSGDFLVDQEFRQVGLLRNLKKPNDSDFTSSTGSALRKLTVSGSLLGKDITIEGGQSGAKAYVNDTEPTGVGLADTILYYHQNEKTGFAQFAATDTGTNSIKNVLDSSDFGNFLSDSDPEVNPFTGELLYIDNRAAITRDSASTEDVKIIIQL